MRKNSDLSLYGQEFLCQLRQVSEGLQDEHKGVGNTNRNILLTQYVAVWKYKKNGSERIKW